MYKYDLNEKLDKTDPNEITDAEWEEAQSLIALAKEITGLFCKKSGSLFHFTPLQ